MRGLINRARYTSPYRAARYRFWKLWYRGVKHFRYRNLPTGEGALISPYSAVETILSTRGDIVETVKPGLTSRPRPVPTNVGSKYHRRVVL